MEEEQNEEKLRCTDCRRAINLGDDLIKAEKGVNGPRGIVPLEETLIFCSEECISDFFNGSPNDDLPEIPRRIS